ncbi:YbaY family lipoprotein [Aeoliella sp. ICT_H6.2]|uniref:YbaY family lipoprotein n=1 Tax=Aeoliella straminimaris TaxID=2954799 RepID=A0A9X2F739_9BACT|nr:YbaY family lipoprotein [Aeoliella straminimaris]MCO6042848.1 YbaY family lipoprotein [Aeoliella straminimaris]
MSPTSSSADWDRNWNGGIGIGNSGANTGWRLGVTGDNTDTGVVVRQVTANSPAARLGLSPGDVIVSVDGDQVGRVGNKIYDLAEELNHHADSSGRVLMLVQYRRNSQLRALNVQLDDQRGGLSGTLLVRGGSLPQNSVVTVRLENVSRPYQAVRNGQYSFRLSSFNLGEIPFSLNYDPNYISPNDSYRLRAYVTSGGRTVYDTAQPPFVLTQGYPNSVRLELRPTSYSSGGVVAAGYNPVDSYSGQIENAYRRYLGRMPTSVELAAWYQTPDLQYRMQRLPLELMGTQEFFDRMGANDFAWVQRAFTEVIGKTPSSVEMDLWMRRFAELRYSRTELLNQLQMQARR